MLLICPPPLLLLHAVESCYTCSILVTWSESHGPDVHINGLDSEPRVVLALMAIHSWPAVPSASINAGLTSRKAWHSGCESQNCWMSLLAWSTMSNLPVLSGDLRVGGHRTAQQSIREAHAAPAPLHLMATKARCRHDGFMLSTPPSNSALRGRLMKPFMLHPLLFFVTDSALFADQRYVWSAGASRGYWGYLASGHATSPGGTVRLVGYVSLQQTLTSITLHD